MTLLRSREIVSTVVKSNTPSKAAKERENSVLEPATPLKTLESMNQHSNTCKPSSSPSGQCMHYNCLELGLSSSSGMDSGVTIRRRSLRLASKLRTTGNVEMSRHIRKTFDAQNDSSCEDGIGLRKSEDEEKDIANNGVLQSDSIETENLASEDVGYGGVDGVETYASLVIVGQSEEDLETGKKGKRKRKSGNELYLLDSEPVGEDKSDKGLLSLRSGKRISKRGMQGRSNNVINGTLEDVTKSEAKVKQVKNSSLEGKKRLSREEKGKRKISVDKSSWVSVAESLKLDVKEKVEILDADLVSGAAPFLPSSNLIDHKEAPGGESVGVMTRRRLSREEKGKGKLVDNEESSNDDDGQKSEKTAEKFDDNSITDSVHLSENVMVQDGNQVPDTSTSSTTTRRGYRERFRDIARRNASRFAHFSSQEEGLNQTMNLDRIEEPQTEVHAETEDWPGPFATAMKIIQDRSAKAGAQEKRSSSERSKTGSCIWVPRKDLQRKRVMLSPPSLQELCLGILSKNADAITSLEGVPDVLRHKLSQVLCDSRKMDSHFFGLLLHGSPTEIRVRDCSWLTEELFERTFEACNTNKLMVLQLDQCGRCMPDYVLSATLARSSNVLSALTTISLKGACRLSDAGLSALVSSAPSLRSINLGQCSLLTADGIFCLAESLSSTLRELYLDDCQGIDAICILPALVNLKHLEVLSVAGIQTVDDDFVIEVVSARGHSMKEICLLDCVKVTDSSVKVIAETCTGLCAIDLSNLCKLTDYAIGYLANGCGPLQRLKLRRNSFSDEAVAAYIETCGESLTELSLNNVNKVGENTAISLAKHSRNLLSLDLSWCRNLKDEALGLIVDSCLCLKMLKLFGCTQVTSAFLDGHSNQQVQIVGLKMTPILDHFKVPEATQGALRYSSLF